MGRAKRRRAAGEGTLEYLPKQGRWRIRLSTPEGRKSFTSKSQAEAIAKRDRYLRERTNFKPSGLTLSDYLDMWLSDVVRPHRAPATYTEYESVTRNHIKPRLGTILISELGAAHLQGLVSEKVREGYAPSGVRRIYAVLSSALKQAVKWKLLAVSPAEGVVLPRSYATSTTATRGALSAEQVRRLFAAAREWRGGRLYPILVLAVSTGLRQGEILGLRWSDIDLDRGTLTVRRTLHQDMTFGPTKAKRERLITLSGALRDMLVSHRRRNALESLRAPIGTKSSLGLVFVNSDGRPVNRAVLLQSFKRLCRREGLPAITFHELRHTCATLLAERGVHPSEVQRILGHADIKTTLGTYTHAWPEQARDAAEGLSELIL
jgi:integrase